MVFSLASSYCRFLTAPPDGWKKEVGQIIIGIIDVALGAWLSLPASLCIFAKTCGHALALEHNGGLYACDHNGDREHFLSNIIQPPISDMVNADSQVQFGLNKKARVSPTCLDCRVWFT